MTIFYFTATGNSLYVAKTIGGKIVFNSTTPKRQTIQL
jgi:flavodoxin